MNKMMQDHSIKKTYYALLQKKPRKLSEDLTHWLVQDGRQERIKSPRQGSKALEEMHVDLQLSGNSQSQVFDSSESKKQADHIR